MCTRMTAKDELDVSIIIVSYNTRALLLDCLRSVFESSGMMTFQVVVVDNNSHDETAEAVRAQYPRVHLIVNQDNRGFSRAVNQSLTVSSGRYVLLLNSDTRIAKTALSQMVADLDTEPTVGAVGCTQRTGDGQLYQSCFSFPSLYDHLIHASFLSTLAPTWQKSLAAKQAIDCTRTQDVDWINGACLMVRRDLLRACGGLDEGYFMYFEDVELCRAIHQRGYRIRHLANTHVVHLIGKSSERNRTQLNLVWEFSRIRYVERHFPPIKRFIMKMWITIGALVRLLLRPNVSAERPSVTAQWSIVRRLWGQRATEEQPQMAGTA